MKLNGILQNVYENQQTMLKSTNQSSLISSSDTSNVPARTESHPNQ